MAEGWIKLHREIVDHWIWQDPERLRAWIDLIMLANHKPSKVRIDNQIIDIQVGQHWTSLEHLADRWGWSVGRVRRFLELLCDDKMILKSGTPRGTLITVVNYGVYQGFDTEKNKPMDKPTDTPTARQRTSQRYTNKNDKNEKNEKKYTRARKSSFQDFDQRTYSYAELEERLVNR